MSISTSPVLRCPRCSAHVRAGSDWCTLCYTDLRPAAPAQVAPEPAPAADAEPAESAIETGSPTGQPPARRGKHARKDAAHDEGGPIPAATPTEQASALADRLLVELAASEAKNPLGALAGAVDSTGKRVALVLGGTGAAICLILLLMAGIGLLL